VSTNQQPAVFVDRDDTLIADPGYLRDPEQIRILPGVPDALKRLRDAGLAVVIVTNQSGVARGFLTEEELQTVHEHLQEQLAEKGAAVDAIYYCPFLDGREAVVEKYRQDSEMRKPRPGMLMKAAADLRLDVSRSWMIGDSVRDIQAGRAAGCRTILLGGGVTDPEAKPDHTMSNFPAAADFILREYRRMTEVQSVLATARRERPIAEKNSTNEGGSIANNPATATAVQEERPKRVPPQSNVTNRDPTMSAVADRSKTPAVEPASSKLQSEADSVPTTPMQVKTEAPTPTVASRPVSTDASARLLKSSASTSIPEKKRAESDMQQTAVGADEKNQVVQVATDATTKRRDADDPFAVMDEILEEVRAIRRQRQFSDFSFMQLAGAIAQAFAVCSVIFGLFAVANGQSDRANLALLTGIAFQLMALTGFVASRRR
jgi:D-glycero-D-manno-heptose 1,7-bisphosphate phosphatase